VEAVVREALGASSVTGLTRLTGGASRQTWTCTVDGVDVVVQRQRAGDDRDMAIEADLVRAAWAAGVPVPELLAFVGGDAAGSGGAATMITRRVVGETIARKILRDDTYREARRRLVADLGRALAGVHRIDPADTDGLVEADPLQALRERLDQIGQSHPTFELAFKWLDEHRPPAPGRTTVVHGDFRLGNVIVDASGLGAVIDWELAHLGDPIEDLGWMCVAIRFSSTGGRCRDSPAAACRLRRAVGRRRRPGDPQVVGGVGDPAVGDDLRDAGVRTHVGHRSQSRVGGDRASGVRERARPVPGARGTVVAVTMPHDPPSAAELVEAVRDWLTREVMPGAKPVNGFHARVAANILAIVEREIELGPAQAEAHKGRLDLLGMADDAELAAAIRSGRLDDRLDEVRRLVWDSVGDKLRVANPKYLDRVEH
jgi:aminoglycoside phosphotransferase (APT) family kinase protein